MPESPLEKIRPVPEPPEETFAPCDVPYAELDVTTNFSFLHGASHPDELMLQAARLGYRAIAVTDINSVAGAVRMFDAHRQVSVKGWAPKLIIGAHLQFTDGPDVIVWAPDRTAYARLCRLLTLGRRRAEKGQCSLSIYELINNPGGLLAGVVPGKPFMPTTRVMPDLRDALGKDLCIVVSRVFGGDDDSRIRNATSLGRQFNVPLLATNAVHYHASQRRPLQDVLTCVRHGCTIHDAGFRLFPNGERYLKSPEQMHRLFSDVPGAIERGLEIAERCKFELKELRYEYPHEVVPPGKTPAEYLRELSYEGAAHRYPQGLPEKIRGLIEKELTLISQCKWEAYFLTVYDLVKFARARGILCQGRGSAANSAVCYCLEVTSVDPAKIDVLFERFISAARGEPPDIDIDFEHERREEVIQYVYNKYGRERAGMTATVITYRGRSAVRDVGKALGLGLDVVDQLAKRLDWWHRGTLTDDQLRESGVDPKDPTVRGMIELTGQLLGFPRHLSQHTGGMVMTRGPLCEMVPIENASMEDRTVIEWDKDDIDAVGILKVDVLALGMLTVLSKALKLINGRHEGTKARRHEGKEGDSHGDDSNAPGSDRLAEGDGAVEGDLPRDAADADIGTVRADEPDETGGGFGSVEHRGRLCARESAGLPETSADFPRLACGALDAVGAGRGPGTHQAECADRCAPGRGGSGPARIDPRRSELEDAANALTAPSTPSCLRAFVPSCLFHKSTSHRAPIELHTIPNEDPATYDMMCDADTVGVFQIESRAQMSMLPRLRPRRFYDIVIEVAIVRPGPIQGNMVHPYLQRRELVRSGRGHEITYESEELRETLAHTLGVPLFQEQAMRVVMVAAGFGAEEADQLRRAMAAWRKNGVIDRFYPKIINGMLSNGYTREFAERVFEQIQGFGEYGFPESHAASFALLVYASAWIKRHHPAVFACALLNSQPMGFYAPAQIVRDARDHGVDVRPVDVNESEWDCTLEEPRETPPPSPRYSGERAGERGERHGGPGTGTRATTAPRHPDGSPGDLRDLGVEHNPRLRDPSEYLRMTSVQCEADPTLIDAVHTWPLSPALSPETDAGRGRTRRGAPKHTWGLNGPALRLGFRQVSGMRQDHAERLVAARRRYGRFTSIEEFHRVTGLPVATVKRLAEADAFGSVGDSRRLAVWNTLPLRDSDAPLFDLDPSPPRLAAPPALPEMPIGQEVMTDYATLRLSLKKHPVAIVRPELDARKILTAAQINDPAMPHGRWVKVAGLVLIRQRPGTASGIVFETLEDETGIVNLIVRPDIYERYRPAARHAALLQCDGYLERQGQVVHIMAKRLFDLSGLLHGYRLESRDFH